MSGFVLFVFFFHAIKNGQEERKLLQQLQKKKKKKQKKMMMMTKEGEGWWHARSLLLLQANHSNHYIIMWRGPSSGESDVGSQISWPIILGVKLSLGGSHPSVATLSPAFLVVGYYGI